MGEIYGYVRVSSREQNEARQMLAMKKAGVRDGHVLVDKQSGKDFDRPEYKRLIGILSAGDTLYIKSIDRLGRNYEEILDQWKYITKHIGADIVIIDMPILDTRQGKDLLGTFVSDIVLQILSFVSENERKNIKVRQREGIDAARIRGVKFGRPKLKRPDNYPIVRREYLEGDLSLRKAAVLCRVSYSTFYRWLNS